ncbi:hypothetical protein HHI36_015215 [Cryptolaemus montrouzieri]|uniref:Uncharacterized protein n=1 Tax=Cryptolaemus montrouzieri TaxID=559131 RepID=A0ABD2N5E6_9CUCU
MRIAYIFERCAVQITLGSKKLILVCIYCPEMGTVIYVDVVLEKLEIILNKCLVEPANFIIAVDFNIDLLSDTREAQAFLSLLDSFNVHATIWEPTRVTATSATCLGIILKNISDIRVLGLSVGLVGYADDVNTLVAFRNVKYDVVGDGRIMDVVNDWCVTNRLILNVQKTERIRFAGAPPRVAGLVGVSDKIVFSMSVRFLGGST